MTGRDPNNKIVFPRQQIENYQKLNLYIPSYLHKKFPDLKPWTQAVEPEPVIKRRLNLMSNPNIINARGIAHSIQFLRARKWTLLNHSNRQNVAIHDGNVPLIFQKLGRTGWPNR